MRLIKLNIATIFLILTLAPAGAQDDIPLGKVTNVRFTDDNGTLAWDAVEGAGSYRISWDGLGDLQKERAATSHVSAALSCRIEQFDPTWTWRARVLAQHPTRSSLNGPYSDWATWTPPTPTRPAATPTATPSGSYRSTYYENRTVYEEESCADRREFRRCRQSCLRADPATCWDLTCGPWLVGVAAPPSCATPVGAPTATATVTPSGSVSCENKIINGASMASTVHFHASQ